VTSKMAVSCLLVMGDVLKNPAFILHRVYLRTDLDGSRQFGTVLARRRWIDLKLVIGDIFEKSSFALITYQFRRYLIWNRLDKWKVDRSEISGVRLCAVFENSGVPLFCNYLWANSYGSRRFGTVWTRGRCND
jgi:hypothetical protein